MEIKVKKFPIIDKTNNGSKKNTTLIQPISDSNTDFRTKYTNFLIYKRGESRNEKGRLCGLERA